MKFYKHLTCFLCRGSRESDCVSAGTSVPTEAPPTPPTASRCLILGLSGAGKSTFLCRIRTGKFQEMQPTENYDVQEVPLSNQIMNLIEIASSNRRNFRLQFMRLAPLSPIGLLFFIDASRREPEIIMKSLEELVYALMYARSRECRVRYLGIVLNKQDLLVGRDDRWRGGLEVVKGMVCDTMKELLSRQQEKQDAPELVAPLRWEVFDHGVSMKTGTGVERILRGLELGYRQ